MKTLILIVILAFIVCGQQTSLTDFIPPGQNIFATFSPYKDGTTMRPRNLDYFNARDRIAEQRAIKFGLAPNEEFATARVHISAQISNESELHSMSFFVDLEFVDSFKGTWKLTDIEKLLEWDKLQVSLRKEGILLSKEAETVTEEDLSLLNMPLSVGLGGSNFASITLNADKTWTAEKTNAYPNGLIPKAPCKVAATHTSYYKRTRIIYETLSCYDGSILRFYRNGVLTGITEY